MFSTQKLFDTIRSHQFVTLAEAQVLGAGRMALSRLVAKGDLHRVERQIYAVELDWLTDPLKKYMPVCALMPEAVVCGISALTYYDLTDQEERKIWIALPHEKRVMQSHLRVVRLSGQALTLGVKKFRFGRREVRIYDREKTVVDAFKYLTEETALKALRSYIRRKDKNMDKLLDYARELKKPLDETVKIIFSEE